LICVICVICEICGFIEAAGKITLHPLNGKYEPRTLPREQVAGMYRAVARFTRL